MPYGVVYWSYSFFLLHWPLPVMIVWALPMNQLLSSVSAFNFWMSAHLWIRLTFATLTFVSLMWMTVLTSWPDGNVGERQSHLLKLKFCQACPKTVPLIIQLLPPNHTLPSRTSPNCNHLATFSVWRRVPTRNSRPDSLCSSSSLFYAEDSRSGSILILYVAIFLCCLSFWFYFYLENSISQWQLYLYKLYLSIFLSAFLQLHFCSCQLV